METKPSNSNRWKFFLLGTLVGFFIFVPYCDKANQNLNFLASKNAEVDLAPNKTHKNFTSFSEPASKPSNVILNDRDKATNKQQMKCNIFDGRWVYKDDESPSYNSIICPYIAEKMKCSNNGRPEAEYEKWRWEARDCDIPMFNGTDMLERLRNKRMILVGDSLNHNMWQSIVCLLFTSIPSSTSKVDERRGYSWRAKEYNFTVEFFWSSFLVELRTHPESGKRSLVLDKIAAESVKWAGADIMIFNSGHWWEPRGKINGLDFFEYKGAKTQDMRVEVAYERSLKTWAKWIEQQVDRNKTMVFFRSYSPVHRFQQYDQWCFNRTQPLTDDSYVPDFPKAMFDVVERLMKGMTHIVKYLNVTKLSEYRIDAHQSMYTGKYEIDKYADCSHWCLPGVPDTWNRLLYASLFFEISSNKTSL